MLDIATAGALAGPAFQSALTSFLAGRINKAFSFASAERVKNDLAPHLENTFKRCIRIKTLINPATQSDFLSIYSTQRFTFRDQELDQFDLVENLKDGPKHVIVTGTGGAGKSMFMKYLWLSLFVAGDGKIPIFVELRNLNKITQADIVPYLFYTLTRGKSRLSIESFRRGLERGEFYVILDGYDELSDSLRDKVQQSIMELAEDYDTTTVIVSSRPDEKFASWANFDVVEVAPLTRDDTVELIERVDFDDTIKDRFIEKVKLNDFYVKNRSFLSNPLLASMMLLAFSQNYDIPEKMHQFYELAFEALYKRHDSYKPGGFKRQFQSTRDEDEFKRVFAFFCLLTFYEQKFSFPQTSIEHYVSSAISLNLSRFSSTSYVKDLCDSVCILIKEGNQYTFPHRSFQEYFAAYCLAFVTRKNFNGIILELCKRHNEQAILMIRDMNPELLRDEFVVPMALKYSGILKNVASDKNVCQFMEATSTRLEIMRVPVKKGGAPEFHIFVNSGGEADDVARTFRRLSGRGMTYRPVRSRKRGTIDEALAPFCDEHLIGQEDRISIFAIGGELKVEIHDRSADSTRVLEPDSEKLLGEIVMDTFLHGFISSAMKDAATYAKGEIEAASKSTNAMRSIFGDPLPGRH